MFFGIENHGNPSHYDLHIENFNSCELKFSIEYQYEIVQLLCVLAVCDVMRDRKQPAPHFFTIYISISIVAALLRHMIQ